MQTNRVVPDRPAGAVVADRSGSVARYGLLFVTLSIATLALLPRVEFPFVAGQYLWAEDGNVFFDDARTLGLGALWTPYAGYLHLYPRLFAGLANPLPLGALPLVYLGAWTIAFFWLLTTLVARATTLGIDRRAIVCVAPLAILQPNDGEVFLNLTNCQWMLGGALALQVFVRSDARESPTGLVAGIVAGLTGPFSVLLLPVVLLDRLTSERSRRDGAMDAVVVWCALVQLLTLLASERTLADGRDLDASVLVGALVRILLFVPTRLREWIPAGVLWTTLAGATMRLWADKEPRGRSDLRITLLLLAAAVALLGASLVTGAFPLSMVEAGGNRYTWIPYLLVFIAVVLSTRGSPASQAIGLVCLAMICHSKFHSEKRPDLHYASFVKLAALGPTSIPINPPTRDVQWALDVGGDRRAPPGPSIGGERFGDPAHDGRAAVVLSGITRIACDHASDLGVEVDAEHRSAGTVTLRWSGNHDFASVGSQPRFYRAGPVRMQFAFPCPVDGVYLKLDPSADVALRRVTVHCLP